MAFVSELYLSHSANELTDLARHAERFPRKTDRSHLSDTYPDYSVQPVSSTRVKSRGFQPSEVRKPRQTATTLEDQTMAEDDVGVKVSNFPSIFLRF